MNEDYGDTVPSRPLGANEVPTGSTLMKQHMSGIGEHAEEGRKTRLQLNLQNYL